MAQRPHLEVQAKSWRELAEKARRLAGNLLDDPAKDSLLRYSEELEENAAKLEASHVPREE